MMETLEIHQFDWSYRSEHVLRMEQRRQRGRPRIHDSDAARQRSRRQRETEEERSSRLEAESNRQLQRRLSEGAGERNARLRINAERQHLRRLSQSEDERTRSRQNNAQRQSRRRALESAQENASRREENAELQRRRRELETAEERSARLEEDVQRRRRRHDLENVEERSARLGRNAQNQRRRREQEGAQERSARLARNAARQSQRRDQESVEEEVVRQAINAERQRRRRRQETVEEQSDRLALNAELQRRRRQLETPEERTTRQSQNAQRQRLRRGLESFEQEVIQIGRGCSASQTTSQHRERGGLDRRCVNCGALHFLAEVKSNHPDTFRECCDFGRIRLNMFTNFPECLRNLFIQRTDMTTEQRRVQKNFLENIRNFNSALAMASMGAQVDLLRGRGPYCYRIHGQIYHRVGPLHPRDGEQRQYGQIYILDTEMATRQRLGNERNADCDPELMRLLSELLSSINMYAQSFKMMSEVEQAELTAAARENRAPLKIRMVFEESNERGLRRRQYDLPTANEVAVVYVGEDNDVPATRSFAVHLRNESGEQLLSIRDIDKICDPLTYPLLFPTGEGGWDPSMTNISGGRITQKEYYSYLLSIRDSFNPILYAGKLFQQFAVDAYVKIEQNRLNFQRRNQLTLRADSYRGLQDYLAGEDNFGPPGRRVILSSSHLGSPRSMQQSYQDAMAIVARYGKPTYFLTMTCNPQWREIQENLYNGQAASDRPDIVARVFNAKLRELCADLFKRHVLGEVQAYVVRTADDVDRSICAEIPNPVQEPELHAAVTSYMIHRQCGQMDSPCMRNGSCSKRFPKQLRERTSVDVDGYPNYRRRNSSPAEINGVLYGDEWVVPSNPHLLIKFDCHVNLEICGMISAVKYLYKYIYKGEDRARINIETEGNAGNNENVDEIKQHLNTRYVCAPQSMHRIFGFSMQEKSHTVCRLAVHLPEFQTVQFVQGREQQYLDHAQQCFTTLTAYFELNRQHAQADGGISRNSIDARELYYYQIPEYFIFKPRSGWSPRERGGNQIGRMYTVSPRDNERYCLRILLLNTKGKTSFEDIRTVDGITFSTFAEAAKHAGFLDDDRYFRQSLEEAIHYQSAACVRSFFACLLCFCEVVDAHDLWNDFAEAMSDDYINRGIDHEIAVAFAYFDILDRMALLGRDFREIVPPPVAERPVIPAIEVDYEAHERDGLIRYETLNARQRAAADDIVGALDRPRNRCIFIDGPGGSGKTYLYNTVYDIVVGRRRQVVCVAWTGIAANLLPGGRTVNSLFKLNIGDGNRSSSMRRQQKEARELMAVDMIIWDEISMAPKVALEAVDVLLKDIMQNDEPFGGKVMVIGGDFRQVLPVVEHGQREDLVAACVHKSVLWSLFSIHRLEVNMRAREAGGDWHERLLKIGNGECNDADGCIQVPEDMMCHSDIVAEIFGVTLDPNSTSELCESAILAPKNIHVQRLNDIALDCLRVNSSQDERVYKSIDEAIYPEGQGEQLFQQEYLNSLTPTGMPPHELRLKKGAIVMLLRNLDEEINLLAGKTEATREWYRKICRAKMDSGPNCIAPVNCIGEHPECTKIAKVVIGGIEEA
ncbi:hypothetical protein OSTOST_21058 [Ostertagia ostertagi]